VGVDAGFVHAFLDRCPGDAEVALFTARWDLVAFFLNPFEQGEMFHPGLLGLAQAFVSRMGIGIELKSLVTHSLSSVYCNYIVAKPVFWRAWLTLAEAFFEYVEHSRDDVSEAIRAQTRYAPQTHTAPLAPMKTFIQERLATIPLASGNFRIAAPDLSAHFPVDSFFENAPQTRQLLQGCNLLKQQYCLTGEVDFLKAYFKLRPRVPVVQARVAGR
jgi:hypothetical protein